MNELDQGSSLLDRGLSRRQLLKGAAAGAGSLALAGSLAEFLAACGGNTTTTTTSKLDANTAGNLEVWHYSSQQDVKTIQDYSALFSQKYPKVNVKLTYVEFSEMPKRAIAAAGAKQGPDVFIYGGNEVNAMYKAGVFKRASPTRASSPTA